MSSAVNQTRRPNAGPPTPPFYPPCQAACPIHQDARGYIQHIAQGNFAQALAIIRQANPLPTICGTICAHPCEAECRRGQPDEPISIRALKRFAVEYGGNHFHPPHIEKRKEKVAIIGSGPAGLTAAYDLALLGFQVTIFEKEHFAGGALSNAIPLYRLPRSLIQKDIDAILALGVELKTKQEMGKDFTLDDLKKKDYKAILLSMGMPLSRGLPIPGADFSDIMLALPFLKAANYEGKKLPANKTVIVVGGGNVAVDVARTARRAGAKKVRMVCLESREEMPAYPWEVQEAMEEGVDVTCSQGPRCILGEKGEISCLETVAVKAVFDAQGRFNPTFYEDRTATIEGNIIIFAIGQAADLSGLKGSAVKVDERGRLQFDPKTMTTSAEGVFASGEVVFGPGTAVQAMASGRRAARFMTRYLQGEPLDVPLPEDPPATPKLLPEVVDFIKRVPRQSVPILEADKRVANFDFVELGYSQEGAIKEARRCLSCGKGAELLDDKCAICLTCVRVCPFGVPVVLPDEKVDIRRSQCQACGLCYPECPAKAIAFHMPGVEDIPSRMQAALSPLLQKGANPAVLAFACSYGAFANSAFAPALKANAQRFAVVTVPCVGKVGSEHLIKAFEMGAGGVYIASCLEPDCPYKHILPWVNRRVEAARKELAQAGIEKERLELAELSTQQFGELPQRLEGFVQKILGLGAK